MKNEKMMRVMRTSKNLQLIINIGLIIGWIAVVFGVAMFVVYGINGGSAGVWLDQLGFEVDENLQTANELSKGQYMVFWGFRVVRMVLVVLAMMKASKVFGYISTKGNPFLTKNTRLVRLVALFLLLAGLVPNIETNLEMGALSISFRWDIVILAVIVFCIALVFDYGAELVEERAGSTDAINENMNQSCGNGEEQ